MTSLLRRVRTEGHLEANFWKEFADMPGLNQTGDTMWKSSLCTYSCCWWSRTQRATLCLSEMGYMAFPPSSCQSASLYLPWGLEYPSTHWIPAEKRDKSIENRQEWGLACSGDGPHKSLLSLTGPLTGAVGHAFLIPLRTTCCIASTLSAV